MPKRSRFKDTDIEEMRKMRRDGYTYKKIAKAFGVTASYVHQLVSGKKEPKRNYPKQLQFNFSFPSKNS